MPRFVCADTARLLEASVESFCAALSGIQQPRRVLPRAKEALFAAEIGLLGASSELAMAACIAQAHGTNYLLLENGFFKQAAVVLKDFRAVLQDPSRRTAFLYAGIDDTPAHSRALLAATESFGNLIRGRAAGLHSGRGPSADVCWHFAANVHQFLDLLARSYRLRTYLARIPNLPQRPPDRYAVLEELVEKVNAGERSGDHAFNAMLLLPEIPQPDDDLASRVEKFFCAPKSGDGMALLADVLQTVPVRVRRVSGPVDGSSVMPVVIRPSDPAAIPISITSVKTTLTSVVEQWRALVGVANGRLESGDLSLPKCSFVYDLFSDDQSRGAILPPSAGTVSAHEVWSFVLAALGQQGTSAPHWFLVSRCGDLGQLKSLLERAASRSNRVTQGKVQRFLVNLDRFGRAVSALDESIRDYEEFLAGVEKSETALRIALSKADKSACLSERHRELIGSFLDGDGTVGAALVGLVEAELAIPDKRYWCRMIASCARAPEDVAGLVAVVKNVELAGISSHAKKALLYIDLQEYGPTLNRGVQAA